MCKPQQGYYQTEGKKCPLCGDEMLPIDAVSWFNQDGVMERAHSGCVWCYFQDKCPCESHTS